MIEEQAQVVAIDESAIWVEAERQSACSRCAANKGCGNATLQKVFGNKRNVIPVPRHVGSMKDSVNVGDKVIIGIEEGMFLKNSFAIYAVPILAIVVFAAIGETFAKDTLSIGKDMASVLGAVTGLVLSIAGLRWYNRIAGKTDCNQPVLIRRVVDSIPGSEVNILG